MEWIAVEVGLPEPYEHCLFYSKSHGLRHGCRDGGNRKIEWFRDWGINKSYKDITHWMPLPKPPK